MAAGRRSRGTSRGTADVRAGWSTAPEPGRDEGDHVVAPDRRARASIARTKSAPLAPARPELGDQQEPPPVDRVGHGAAAEGEDEDRDELDEGEEPDRERRAGQHVELERERDHRDLAARPR